MPRFTWRLKNRTLEFGRPLVMGIVNVTPDSFSDGGQFLDQRRAIDHALRLVQDGADILDIGGESTRPGSQPVSLDEELRRMVPVVQALTKQTSATISVDTSKSEVARQCLDAGAAIINDVTALRGDPGMVDVARNHRAGVILMHMQGTPATMQLDPKYDDVVREVHDFLGARLKELEQAGLPRETLAIDPGIGFGKRHAHNLSLLAGLESLLDLQRPICLGVSRKGFIGKIIGKTVAESDIGSVAVACHAMAKGAAQILRVHNVAATVEAVKMMEAVAQY
jgi:dihydropteroate synthase